MSPSHRPSSAVIGLCLILDCLRSRTVTLIIGITGLFYGITGVAQLGVKLDWVLLAGAVMLVVSAFVQGRGTPGPEPGR